MPFQKTLPDIPTPVPPSQPAQADTTTAQLIQAVGEIAGQSIKGVQKNRLEADIQQSADVATAIAGAVEEKGQSAFTTTGEISTEGLSSDLQTQIAGVQKTASDKFKRIASAVRQGALPASAAALETEATVRALVNQTPGFGQEIKELARSLLGFDPTGYALRQVLDIGKPTSIRVTAQQKRMEEALTMQDGLSRAGQSVALDTILGNLALRDAKNTEQETLDSQLGINTLSIQQWAQQSFVERGPDLSNTLLRIVQIGAEGGVTDPTQYTNAIIGQREADKQEFRQRVAQEGGMHPDAARGIETQIDAMYDPLITTMKDSKRANFIATKIDLIAKMHQLWGKRATPKLTRILDAYGDRIGGQLLEMMNGIADPKQFELIYQFDPGIKELVESGQITQRGVADRVEVVVDKILKGVELTEEDLRFRTMAETMVTQPGSTALREAYVKGLGESGAPVRAVSILSEKVSRVNATPDEVKFIKDQFSIHVGTKTTESIPGNLVDGMARELIKLEIEATELEGDVKLITQPNGSVKFTVRGVKGGFEEPRDLQTTSMKRVQPYLDAVMVKGYAADLGVSKEGFAPNLLVRVKDRMELLKVEAFKVAKEIEIKRAQAQAVDEDE